jgi:hypothetical protein
VGHIPQNRDLAEELSGAEPGHNPVGAVPGADYLDLSGGDDEELPGGGALSQDGRSGRYRNPAEALRLQIVQLFGQRAEGVVRWQVFHKRTLFQWAWTIRRSNILGYFMAHRNVSCGACFCSSRLITADFQGSY